MFSLSLFSYKRSYKFQRRQLGCAHNVLVIRTFSSFWINRMINVAHAFGCSFNELIHGAHRETDKAASGRTHTHTPTQTQSNMIPSCKFNLIRNKSMCCDNFQNCFLFPILILGLGYLQHCLWCSGDNSEETNYVNP